MNGEASATAAAGGGKKGSLAGGKKVNGLASVKKALSPPPAVPQPPTARDPQSTQPTQHSPAAGDGNVRTEAAAVVGGKALCAKKPPLPASASRQERAANSTVKDTTDGDRVLFTLYSMRVQNETCVGWGIMRLFAQPNAVACRAGVVAMRELRCATRQIQI